MPLIQLYCTETPERSSLISSYSHWNSSLLPGSQNLRFFVVGGSLSEGPIQVPKMVASLSRHSCFFRPWPGGGGICSFLEAFTFFGINLGLDLKLCDFLAFLPVLFILPMNRKSVFPISGTGNGLTLLWRASLCLRSGSVAPWTQENRCTGRSF